MIKRFAVTVGVLFAVAAVVVLGVVGGGGAASAGEPVQVLSPDYVRGVSEECWGALLDAGYKGRAGDDREALYVPAGVLAELCSRD
jgi:hypothetical protein